MIPYAVTPYDNDLDPSRRDPGLVVLQPGPRTLDCIIAAAAAMALADGCAEPAEQRGLFEFLRRNRLLDVLGRSVTRQRFVSETCEAALHPGSGFQLAERLRPLAGTSGARLVATAAAWVAIADGVVHPDELRLLRSLRAMLGLALAVAA